MDIKEAWAIVGGLSKPSKMPCYSFSLPTSACYVGSKLRLLPNTVCSTCYADKWRYRWRIVQEALLRRLKGIKNPLWCDAMVYLINHLEASGYFRWLDSGDVQGRNHLNKIVEVCQRTPHIQHWLPTKEHNLIKQYLKERGNFPSNLCVRLSVYMLEQSKPSKGFLSTMPTSGVAKSYDCPAVHQKNKCLTCRRCWNRQVSHVVYHKG